MRKTAPIPQPEQAPAATLHDTAVTAAAPAGSREHERAPTPADPLPAWHEEAGDGEPQRQRPRRNPARLLTILAVVAALIMIAALAAIYTTGLPQVTQRLGLATDRAPALAISGTATPEQLPNNKVLLTVNGQIRNLTEAPQRVPQIRAEVISAEGRSIYSWSIAPPVTQLPPGGTATFNSASTDVPPGGRNLSLSFAPMT